MYQYQERGGMAVQGLPGADIDSAAAESRQRLAPTKGVDEAIDPIAVLEALDGRQFKVLGAPEAVTIRYAVTPLPYGVEGRTLYDHDGSRMLIELSPLTYAGLEGGDSHDVFTLIHEAGHVKFHARELVKLRMLPHKERAMARGDATHRVFQDSEWQADRFAGAFMAPNEGLALLEQTGHLTTSEVSALFGLSPASASIRIRNYRKHLTSSQRRI